MPLHIKVNCMTPELNGNDLTTKVCQKKERKEKQMEYAELILSFSSFFTSLSNNQSCHPASAWPVSMEICWYTNSSLKSPSKLWIYSFSSLDSPSSLEIWSLCSFRVDAICLSAVGEHSGTRFILFALITDINNWLRSQPEAFCCTLHGNPPVAALISIAAAYLSSGTLQRGQL